VRQRYQYLLEILIGIFVILFINVRWFGSNMGYAGVSPNPYWAVVLFVAVRHGSIQGLMAALFCSTAVIVSVGYNISMEQHFEFAKIPYKQFLLAALFIVVGFLLGEERSRLNLTVKKWQEKLQKLHSHIKAKGLDVSTIDEGGGRSGGDGK